jgi:hypothetical protein
MICFIERKCFGCSGPVLLGYGKETETQNFFTSLQPGEHARTGSGN